MAWVVDGGRYCMVLYVVCKMYIKFAKFTKKLQPCTRRPPRKVDSAESCGDVWGRGNLKAGEYLAYKACMRRPKSLRPSVRNPPARAINLHNFETEGRTGVQLPKAGGNSSPRA